MTFESAALEVIDAIASHEGVAATDLPPLEESIDTDALEDIIAGWTERPDAVDGNVCFYHAGCHVTVERSGDVRVGADHPLTARSDGTSKLTTDD